MTEDHEPLLTMDTAEFVGTVLVASVHAGLFAFLMIALVQLLYNVAESRLGEPIQPVPEGMAALMADTLVWWFSTMVALPLTAVAVGLFLRWRYNHLAELETEQRGDGE